MNRNAVGESNNAAAETNEVSAGDTAVGISNTTAADTNQVSAGDSGVDVPGTGATQASAGAHAPVGDELTAAPPLTPQRVQSAGTVGAARVRGHGNKENDDPFQTPGERGTQEDDDCPICISPMVTITGAKPLYKILKCGHTFHRGCLEENRGAGNHGCPICRGELEPGLTPAAPTMSPRTGAASVVGSDALDRLVHSQSALRMFLAALSVDNPTVVSPPSLQTRYATGAATGFPVAPGPGGWVIDRQGLEAERQQHAIAENSRRVRRNMREAYLSRNPVASS